MQTAERGLFRTANQGVCLTFVMESAALRIQTLLYYFTSITVMMVKIMVTVMVTAIVMLVMVTIMAMVTVMVMFMVMVTATATVKVTVMVIAMNSPTIQTTNTLNRS